MIITQYSLFLESKRLGRIVLTGSPGTGKTEVIRKLREMKYHVIPEPSRELLKKNEKITITREWYDRIANLFGPQWEKDPLYMWSLDFRKPTDRGVWHVIIGMLYDEWFYVIIRYSGRPVSNEWCFKCDQFDGLVQLLKVKGIIE